MRREELAPREHVATLASELDRMHGGSLYRDCQTMGELTALHISTMLEIPAADNPWDSQY
jgi:hypothetical protein